MFTLETTIRSPLDQFEIRNLFSIDTPLLGNMNLSITNIGLYMTIAAFVAFSFSILATNNSKIAPNK
jgi:F-type H+-transporting ATPase subunit a